MGIEGKKGGRGFRFIDGDAHVYMTGGTLEVNCLNDNRTIDVDNFELYPGAMVKAGKGKSKAELLPRGERAGAYKKKKNSYVYICSCDHKAVRTSRRTVRSMPGHASTATRRAARMLS